MSLKDRRQEILAFVKAHAGYIQFNKDLFSIYSGNLRPFVEKVMELSLSKNYFEKIKHLITPINVLPRMVGKMGGVYGTAPMRAPLKESASDLETIRFYEDHYDLDQNMDMADDFANLFKGYAAEPFLVDGFPRLRILPFDRFLVIPGVNSIDQLEPEVFVKFLGKRAVKGKDGKIVVRDIFHTYTDLEFDAFDDSGDTFQASLRGNDGINPFKTIPFMYGGRSSHSILPVQDSDMKALTIAIPVMFSDLAGAQQFQCFSIIYGVDVDAENLTMSPNAFWSLKSEPGSKGTPVIGTISPQVKITECVEFIRNVLAFWFETKGIKVGSLGKLSGEGFASGISKIIDEMDTFEIRRANILWFQKEEARLWDLTKSMHNVWVDSGALKGFSRLGDDFGVSVTHDEPKPRIDRSEAVDTVIKEMNAGLLDIRRGIERINPNMSTDDVDDILTLTGENENEDTNESGQPATRTDAETETSSDETSVSTETTK